MNVAPAAEGRSPLSRRVLAMRSIRYFPRLLLPIAAGVAVAAATILGALLIGDSLRGSLRANAVARLGEVETVALAPVAVEPTAFAYPSTITVPLQLYPAVTVERGERRSNRVLLMGVNADLAGVSDDVKFPIPEPGQIVLNESAAKALEASVSDRLVVRIPDLSAVNSDNALADREADSVAIASLELIAIAPDASLAGFQLSTDPSASQTALLAAEDVQKALEQPGRFNAAFYERTPPAPSLPERAEQLHLSLEDLNLRLRHVVLGEPSNPVGDYWQLETDALLLPEAVVERVVQFVGEDKAMPILTYLANGIARDETVLDGQASDALADDEPVRLVPYSTISGVPTSAIGDSAASWQLPLADGTVAPLDGDDCYIVDWLAERLAVGPGDELAVEYFESELRSGQEVRRIFHTRVAAVLPLTAPERPYRRDRPAQFDEPPTPFNDPQLTPEVAGITDQDSISDWDAPFPLVYRVSSADDEYWKNHRLTPKIYIPLNRAQELFGSRFGNVSSIRIDPAVVDDPAKFADQLATEIRPVAASMGWQVLPLRQRVLEAAEGTTPFDLLFLGLSLFVIASAIMLIFLLMRLAIESRANQLGLLLATGWSYSRVRSLLLIESTLLIAVGLAAGIPLGVGFCQIILGLLRGGWSGAVGVLGDSGAVTFHWSVKSVSIGLLASFLVTLATVYWSLRVLRRYNSTELLSGASNDETIARRRRGVWDFVAVVVAVAAVLALPATSELQGPAKAGGQLACGAAVLAAGCFLAYRFLTRNAAGGQSLTRLTMMRRSLARSRLRTMLALVLPAVAVFLLATVSVFSLQPDRGGTGGFDLIAISNRSIGRDLGDANVRRSELGSQADAVLADSVIVSLRLRPGDAASCANPYQADQPAVLGVPDKMVAATGREGRFAWASPVGPEENPWAALQKTASGTADDPIPAIVDQNTALWALHLSGKVGEVYSFEYPEGRTYFRSVGLLQNTILQGYLLIGESNLTRIFPATSGYQVFLVDVDGQTESGGDSSDQIAEASRVLERGWEVEGLDAQSATAVLERLLAVQNTYLTAFQALGFLGLLLGVCGVAIIQYRSVMERRGEQGLLLALGYRQRKIQHLLLGEQVGVLTSSVAIAGVSAAIVIAAARFSGQPVGSWFFSAMLVATVLLAGTLASAFAIRIASRTPVLDALRD